MRCCCSSIGTMRHMHHEKYYNENFAIEHPLNAEIKNEAMHLFWEHDSWVVFLDEALMDCLSAWIIRCTKLWEILNFLRIWSSWKNENTKKYLDLCRCHPIRVAAQWKDQENRPAGYTGSLGACFSCTISGLDCHTLNIYSLGMNID
jgi:hypothetical protein